MMNHPSILPNFWKLLLMAVCSAITATATESIDLSGEWKLALDLQDMAMATLAAVLESCGPL